MKKILKLIVLIISFGFISTVSANSIDNISIDVLLDDNGNAYITEVWNAYIDEGTEGYHSYSNMGNSIIEDFEVTDDSGNKYTYINNWDVDESFENKKYKNGIYVDDDEVELCWGISEYGTKKYTLKYTVKNIIYNTEDDYQILYWQFINEDLSPKKYSVKIHNQDKKILLMDNMIYGYGTKDSRIYSSNDGVEIKSPERILESDEYLDVLIKYPSNFFDTKNKIDQTWDEVFEDVDFETDRSYITIINPSTNNNNDNQKDNKNETKPNTDNNTSNDVNNDVNDTSKYDVSKPVKIGVIIFLIIAPFLCLYLMLTSNRTKYKKEKKVLDNSYNLKNVNVFRDIPISNNYLLVEFIANEYDLVSNNSNFLGAIVLKWIKDGNIKINNIEKGKGIFKVNSCEITLVKEPVNSNLEKELNAIFSISSENNILDYNKLSNNKIALKNWCSNFYQDLFDEIKTNTEYFQYDSNRNKYIATDKLTELSNQIAGLRLFLKEFSLSNEKQAIEVNLWKDYLIYAEIFGIANEVEKQLNTVYPELVDNNFDIDSTLELINYMSDTLGALISTSAGTISQIVDFAADASDISSGGGGSGAFGSGGGGGGFR